MIPQSGIESGIRLLQIRLKRIGTGTGYYSKIALRLQRLAETVVIHRDLLTTEREIVVLAATIDTVEDLKRQAGRDR